VVWLIERGHALSTILDLPLPAFDSLFMSAFRLASRDRADRLRDIFLSSQASGKDIEKIAEELDKISQPAKEKSGMASFLQKHGSGI